MTRASAHRTPPCHRGNGSPGPPQFRYAHLAAAPRPQARPGVTSQGRSNPHRQGHPGWGSPYSLAVAPGRGRGPRGHRGSARRTRSSAGRLAPAGEHHRHRYSLVGNHTPGGCCGPALPRPPVAAPRRAQAATSPRGATATDVRPDEHGLCDNRYWPDASVDGTLRCPARRRHRTRRRGVETRVPWATPDQAPAAHKDRIQTPVHRPLGTTDAQRPGHPPDRGPASPCGLGRPSRYSKSEPEASSTFRRMPRLLPFFCMPADLADVDLSLASGFGASDAVAPVPFPLAGRGVRVFFSGLGSGPGLDDSPALPAGEGF